MSRVVHFEIHASDPARAVKFYESVFGWGFRKWDGPMPYWFVTTGPEEQPGINGGVTVRQGSPPAEGQAVNAYVCTIGVASVDESVGKVTDSGGTIALAKMPVPGVGWLAYAKDTEGNIFGIMQPDTNAR